MAQRLDPFQQALMEMRRDARNTADEHQAAKFLRPRSPGFQPDDRAHRMSEMTTVPPMRSSTSCPTRPPRPPSSSRRRREIDRDDAVVVAKAFGDAAEEVGSAAEAMDGEDRRTGADVLDVHGERPATIWRRRVPEGRRRHHGRTPDARAMSGKRRDGRPSPCPWRRRCRRRPRPRAARARST